MTGVRVPVVAPKHVGLGLCTVCELVLSGAGVGEQPGQRALDEYPEEWQEDYRCLIDRVNDLADRYGDRILIKVIDPNP
jgi:hypothetical protein